MSWFEQLRPASFRGVPFFVRGTGGAFGRRSAVHEYPFRDDVWVEDLGRSARRFRVNGFLVGDDVIAQREIMIGAVETKDKGLLIHPTYGELTVSVPEGGFNADERWDAGRYFEISFSFIEAGARKFPNAVVATVIVVQTSADAADEACLASFVDQARAALKYGSSVVSKITGTVSIWARMAQRLANDATNMKNMCSTLQGSYGRYFGGRTKGFSAATNAALGTSSSINTLLSIGATSRTNVGVAGTSLTSIAGKLGL